MAYLFLCLGAADFGVELYRKVKDIKGMKLFAAAFLFFAAFSGVLTLEREWVSEYQLYGTEQVSLAEYVMENTPADAVFLTTTRHNNEIASLTGRNVVCAHGLGRPYQGLRKRQYQRSFQIRGRVPQDCRVH